MVHDLDTVVLVDQGVVVLALLALHPALAGVVIKGSVALAGSCPLFSVSYSTNILKKQRASGSKPDICFGQGLYCFELSSLLTVKTLTGMTTDVYPRENCIAPAMVFIVWTTDTKNGRD